MEGAWCDILSRMQFPGCSWFERVGEQEQYPFAFLFPEQNGGRAEANRELSRLNGKDGMFGSARAVKGQCGGDLSVAPLGWGAEGSRNA